MTYRVIAGVCASLAALAAAGCGSGSEKASKSSSSSSGSSSSSASAAKGTAPGAKVTFLSPKAGSSVASPVTAKVQLVGFKINANDVGKAPKQGEGHLHFKMDEGKYDLPKYSGANGKLAVKLGVQGKYSPSVTPTITYTGLPKGKHKLEVYLANNDHSDTGVEASTSFSVK
jgi:hypothetical protein